MDLFIAIFTSTMVRQRPWFSPRSASWSSKIRRLNLGIEGMMLTGAALPSALHLPACRCRSPSLPALPAALHRHLFGVLATFSPISMPRAGMASSAQVCRR